MLSAGTRLGPYEIQSAIGAGGMGEVYRARDTRLDRIVAIKVLRARLDTDPELRSRFDREARNIAALSHPRICTLYDVGHQEGIDFLVMEYLEGETLSARLKRGRLSLDQTLKIGIEICDALVSAHRRGLVHRDLKPGNVMLTRGGAGSTGSPQAKLLDFGLAKTVAPPDLPDAAIDVTMPQALTGQGVMVGTLAYMAPEQIDGRRIDDRTDIFAFGAVLYEMATGSRAFEGDDRTGLIVKILDREPVPLSERLPSVPPAFERVVRKCLAKDPDDRWQTARDLLDELKWIDATGADSAAVPVAAPRRLAGRLRVAALGIVLAALGLAVGYFVKPADAPPIVRLSLLPPEQAQFGDFAVSPDGTRVVFVATQGRTTQLWTRSLDGSAAQLLAGTTEAHNPAWSPDGQSIAFFGGDKLQRIAATGGTVQILCEAPQGRGVSWGSAGVIVFAPNILGPLSRVPDTGGRPAPVTSLDEARQEDSHRLPTFLPDGRHFLFVARTVKRDDTAVYIGSIDSPERTHLLAVESRTAYVPPGFVLFLREGTRGALMALPFDAAGRRATGAAFPADDQVPFDLANFSASSAGLLAYTSSPSHSYTWFDRAGKALSALALPGQYGRVALSADGTRAAVRRAVQGNPDIWVIDFGGGDASRVTSHPAVEDDPLWSPAGDRIAFSSTRDATKNIYATQASGAGEEELLLKSDRGNEPTDWSSDGRFIVFTRDDPVSLSDIWALPLFSDRRPFPVLRTEFIEEQGRVSADGRWIVYSSNKSGRWEVYVQGFPRSSGQWQVSPDGGLHPRWRRDGRELFFIDPKGTLTAVPMRLGATVGIGAPVPLFQTGLSDPGLPGRYAVAPDGQRFLMDVEVDDESRRAITLVVNGTARLTRK